MSLNDLMVKLELAGVTAEHLGRGPLPSGELEVPTHIFLVRDTLAWDYHGGTVKQVDTRGILQAFIRITSPDQMLRFAQRYGPLRLCRHGRAPHPDEETGAWCGACGQERFEDWRSYIGWATAIIRLAIGLATHDFSPFRGVAKLLLIDAIDQWIEQSNLRPRLDWTEHGPEITLTGGGVLGALGVELLHAVTRSPALAICDGCGAIYLPERKPRADRRRWCRDCRSTVANRERQARWRRRHRQGDNDSGGHTAA